MQETQETGVRSQGGQDPLEEGMASHSSYSCLENPTDRGAWWIQSMGSQRVGPNWSTLARNDCSQATSEYLIMWSLMQLTYVNRVQTLATLGENFSMGKFPWKTNMSDQSHIQSNLESEDLEMLPSGTAESDEKPHSSQGLMNFVEQKLKGRPSSSLITAFASRDSILAFFSKQNQKT